MEIIKNGIYQYTPKGVFIAKYETIKEAATKNHYLASTLSNAIAGRTKTAYNYKWLSTKKYYFNFKTKQIVDIVVDITNISHETLIVKNRKREIVRARQLVHYFLRKDEYLSSAQIGLLTGGQDHATVLHSCRKIKGYLDINDLLITTLVNACQKEIDKIRSLNFKMWIPIYEHSKI